MESEKSFLNLKSFNLVNLSIQLLILLVLTNLLTMGKPVQDNLLIGQKKVSPVSLPMRQQLASRRFGPQFWGQSEKHIQLCEHICSTDPSEGQKYCNCTPEPSMGINGEDDQRKLNLTPQQQPPYQNHNQQLQSQVDQHASSGHQQQATIQIPEVNYLGAHEASQMCDYLCLENPNEAIKYCNCQNHNNIIPDNNGNNVNIDNNQINSNNLNNFNNPPVNNQMMASSEQITSEQQNQQPQLTLADYLKFDPSTERQLCSYLCTENSLKLNNNQYCNCKTKKVNQQSDKIMATGKNQHSKKSQLISELGKPNSSSNPVAIKNILDAAVDSNHRKELCSYVCALEPNEGANNQCNCNQSVNNQKESGKSSRSRFHLNPWRSIKKWFG